MVLPPRMTRKQLAEFLKGHGFPIALSTLEKLCSPAIGRGPPIAAWWGNRPLYEPAPSIAWAEGRLRPTRGEQSEDRAA
jgi:hypothetical protein